MIRRHSAFCKLPAGLMTKAPDDVIVDEARCLHVRVDDRTANELKAAFLEVLAKRIGLRRRRRNIRVLFEVILDGLGAHKLPDVFAETAKFFLHGEKRPGIRYGRVHLETIAHDARVQQQFFNALVRKASDLYRVKVSECLTVAFTLVEYRRPAEARLRAFEDQELKLHAVVVKRNAPLRVVILDVVEADTFGPFAACYWFCHGRK
jgi:hypothetical protein